MCRLRSVHFNTLAAVVGSIHIRSSIVVAIYIATKYTNSVENYTTYKHACSRSAIIVGASEVKPLSSGWCETGSHDTSKPDGTLVVVSWGEGLLLARDRSAAEPRRRVINPCMPKLRN